MKLSNEVFPDEVDFCAVKQQKILYNQVSGKFLTRLDDFLLRIVEHSSSCRLFTYGRNFKVYAFIYTRFLGVKTDSCGRRDLPPHPASPVLHVYAQ